MNDQFDQFWDSLNMNEGLFYNTLEHSASSQVSESQAPTNVLRTYYQSNGFMQWAKGMRQVKFEQNLNDTISKTLQTYFDNINSEHGAEDWMQLMAALPFCSTQQYHTLLIELLQKSENLLYDHKTCIVLKSEYKVQQNLQNSFNFRRAYHHAEMGDFDAAKQIIQSMTELDMHAIDRIDVIFMSFIAHICTGQWEQCIHNVHKMWSILNLLDTKVRYDHGVWSIWFITNTVLTAFSQHCPDLQNALIGSIYSNIKSISSSRQRFLLAGISYTSIAMWMGLAYYQRAKLEIPNLPDVTIDDILKMCSTGLA
jgi:hypothetical protein